MGGVIPIYGSHALPLYTWAELSPICGSRALPPYTWAELSPVFGSPALPPYIHGRSHRQFVALARSPHIHARSYRQFSPRVHSPHIHGRRIRPANFAQELYKLIRIEIFGPPPIPRHSGQLLGASLSPKFVWGIPAGVPTEFWAISQPVGLCVVVNRSSLVLDPSLAMDPGTSGVD